MNERTKESHGSHPPRGGAPTAAYIAHLTTELAAMARGQGFQTLAYLLDMARLEADTLTGPPDR